jgi:hypothetical protein
MKNSGRMQLLLIGLTVLALAAGVAAGMLASRGGGASSSSSSVGGTPTTGTTAPVIIDRTPLVQELQLSPEQRDRMREIWEAVRGDVHETFSDAQRLQRQREDALVALLTDEQKAQFEKISKDYADQFAELTRKRDKVFQQAVERTRGLLNDEQRRRYEQILKSATGRDGGLPPLSPPLGPPSLAPTTSQGGG